MSRKINSICFSGTGNTRWIVDHIVKVLHMGKCEFCMHCGAVCKNGAVHIKGKPNLRIRSVALSGLVCEEGSEQ